MRTNALASLERDADGGIDSKTLKRAEWEGFTFRLGDDAGSVVVRNNSYADASGHEYTVTVEDGVPVACTCQADQHHEGPCKHRVAVAIRAPVMEAATAEPAVRPDGGAVGADADGEECEECTRLGHACAECYIQDGKAWSLTDDHPPRHS